VKKSKPEKLVALLETYEDGLMPEEIAFEMGFSTVGSVPSAISRARNFCLPGKTITCFRFPDGEYTRPGKIIYKLTSIKSES